MSSNMGNRTNSEASMQVRGNFHEAPGLPVLTVCPCCGQKKKPGKSYPQCSRRLQKMRQQGLLG